MQAHNESIRHVLFVHDTDKLILTAAFDRKVKLWDPESGLFYDSFRQGDKFKPRPVDFKPREASASAGGATMESTGSGAGEASPGGALSGFGGYPSRSSTKRLNQVVTSFISNKHNLQHIFHKLHLKRNKRVAAPKEQEDLHEFLRLLMSEKLEVYEKIKAATRKNKHSTEWRFFPNIQARLDAR